MGSAKLLNGAFREFEADAFAVDAGEESSTCVEGREAEHLAGTHPWQTCHQIGNDVFDVGAMTG